MTELSAMQPPFQLESSRLTRAPGPRQRCSKSSLSCHCSRHWASPLSPAVIPDASSPPDACRDLSPLKADQGGLLQRKSGLPLGCELLKDTGHLCINTVQQRPGHKARFGCHPCTAHRLLPATPPVWPCSGRLQSDCECPPPSTHAPLQWDSAPFPGKHWVYCSSHESEYDLP